MANPIASRLNGNGKNTMSVREILTAVKTVPSTVCSQLRINPDLLSDYMVSSSEEGAEFSVPVSGVGLVFEGMSQEAAKPLQTKAGKTITLLVKPGPQDHCFVLRDPTGVVRECVVDYQSYSMTDRRRLLGFLHEILVGDPITDVSDVFAGAHAPVMTG